MSGLYTSLFYLFFTFPSVYMDILNCEYKKGDPSIKDVKKKMVNIKILNLSILIVILLTFLITPDYKKFGAPFLWVTYYGDKGLESSLTLLKLSNIVLSHFNMFAFTVNVLIIYLLLFYCINMMKKIYTINQRSR